MSHKTGFYEGRLGIGLANDGGDGTGNPRFPLDVNGDIRLTGAILKANGEKYLGGLTKIGFDNMTELQNGNIGVGTETPTVLFDISGNTKIGGDLNIVGTFTSDGLKVGNYVDYSFSKETKIEASDKTLHDAKYGDSVAISGNYAIVGSRDNRNSGSGNGDPASTFGAAYIYNVQTGQEIHKLISPNATLYYSFGYSVDIDGNYAIISEPGNNSSKGVAYIFNVATGTNIREIAPNSSDVSNYDYFGRSVAISGNYAIIGASNDDDSKGSAYIFNISTGTQLFKIEDTNGQGDPMGMGGGDQFGWSVAIDGDYAIIGSPNNATGNISGGSAFIFNVTTGTQLHKLAANNGNNSDRFGNSVAISGNYAIIGAPYEDETASNSGTAYIFNVITGTQVHKLNASDLAGDNHFGFGVAINGNYAIIGAKQSHNNSYNDNGSAYIFDVITGVEIGEIFGSDTTGYERFGNSVGIDGNIIVVGASSSNSAYIFGPNTPSGPILNITDDLQINGNTHINGTLSATTLTGNLAWSNITSQPDTITTAQANEIVANNLKVSSQWTPITSKIYYNGGNVGIGTTGPNYRLDVEMSGGNGGIRVKNTTNSAEAVIWTEPDYASYLYFGANNANKWSISSRASGEGYDLKFYRFNPGALEVMTMDYATGNVGIGTNSPNYKLSLGEGNGNTAGSFAIFEEESTGNYFYGMNAKLNCLNFFASSGDDSDSNIRMSILKTSGNVGIGTTAPSRPLQINTDQQASIQLERNTGSGYARIGINTQFSIGEYNNQDIPWANDRSQMNAFFIEYSGGESNWDNEGAYFWMNGDYTAFANTGDCNANGGVLHYYDSDLHVEGENNGIWHINYNGSITNNSDITLKENIRYFDDEYNISNIKEKYSQIKFCKYNYKKPLKDPSGVKRDYYGIIAQELELLFPETICQDNNGIRSFKNNVLQCITSHITANLIKENQELKTEVATLKSELAAIKAHLGI